MRLSERGGGRVEIRKDGVALEQKRAAFASGVEMGCGEIADPERRPAEPSNNAPSRALRLCPHQLA